MESPQVAFNEFIHQKVHDSDDGKKRNGPGASAGGAGAETEAPLSSGMHLEILRLATFHTWPQWVSMPPNRLARFGFFFTGREDEVQCFSCGVKVKGWHPGDLPDFRHRRVRTDCPLLQGLEENNVSLPRPVEDADTDAEMRRASESLPEPLSEPMHEARPHNPSSPVNENPVPLESLLPDYKNEQIRRQTFGNWPPHAYVGPDELAQAGFIYLGSQDRVQCVFCKGVLKNWAPGDRAFHEHQQKFPHCPFVKNPRIGRAPERVLERSYGVYGGTSTFTGEAAALASLSALGIDTDMPKNHGMALLQVRVETFKNWPKPQVQKPRILAEAGFYFIDRADSVKCFWCDGGLKNWEATDDPWVEHVRWFPKCGHMKRTKGQEFVDYVSKHGRAPPGHSPAGTPVDMREVSARMDTGIVQGVLNMGFDRDLVQNVIYYKLAKDGDDFARTEDLLDTVLNYSSNPPLDFPLALPTPPAAPAPAPVPAPAPAAAAGAAAEAAPTAGSAGKNKRKKKNKKKAKEQSATATGSASGTVPQSSSSAPSTVSKNEDSGNDDSDQETAMDTEEDERREAYSKRTECCVCMENTVDIVFLPCRHLVCCHDCAPPLSKCPCCRGHIKGTINVFMP